MSVVAKRETNFIQPPDGAHLAVAVDVTEPQTHSSPWGERTQFRIVWELAAKMEDGKPYLASKFYTLSLHEKSNLYKDLNSWRGKKFTEEELKGFDVENVIGASAQLVITSEEKEGERKAKVVAVIKSKEKLEPSGSYQRVKDRPVEKTEQNNKAETIQTPVIEEDDIPF